MDVIKHGTQYEKYGASCPGCKAVLRFVKREIKTEFYHGVAGPKYVTCPECSYLIRPKFWRKVKK